MSALSAPAPCVAAVVVAFRPDVDLFARLVAAICPQVSMLFVVDNARGVGLESTSWNGRLERVDMQGNAGIAAAQNAGIRRALALQASHVLLLDHDSVPSVDLVEKLLAQSQALESRGERVAAVGADYHDGRHATKSPFIAMRWTGYGRAEVPNAYPIRVPFLISAGTLISATALDEVGLMDERLFIDYVDIEWCLRAQTRGRYCFGIPGAALEHRLGDELLRWGRSGRPVRWLGRTISSRSPLRHYYLFRNGSWLIFHGAVPLRWKLLELKRLLACFAAFASMSPDRSKQIKAMARGLTHGLLGILGPAH